MLVRHGSFERGFVSSSSSKRNQLKRDGRENDTIHFKTYSPHITAALVPLCSASLCRLQTATVAVAFKWVFNIPALYTAESSFRHTVVVHQHTDGSQSGSRLRGRGAAGGTGRDLEGSRSHLCVHCYRTANGCLKRPNFFCFTFTFAYVSDDRTYSLSSVITTAQTSFRTSTVGI